MREIVLDTETTGLNPSEGHRIVEIGAVELHNHVPTGRSYHQYINPERPMPEEAFAVHGLGDAFLADKPVFAAVVEDFIAFCGEAKLVIHNAAFDMRFINAELARAGHREWSMDRALDTVALARRAFPGSPASLDALCRRFAVDNSAREKHGALLDSELLAEVYLELIGGRQPGLELASTFAAAQPGDPSQPEVRSQRPRALAPRISAAERAAHRAFVEELGETALWRQIREADPAER